MKNTPPDPHPTIKHDWEHPTNWSDVEHWQQHNCWPNETTPQWAKERAQHYNKSPESHFVQYFACIDETRRLEKRIKEINTSTQKYSPENTAEQAQHKITVVVHHIFDEYVLSKNGYSPPARGPIEVFLAKCINKRHQCYLKIEKALEPITTKEQRKDVIESYTPMGTLHIETSVQLWSTLENQQLIFDTIYATIFNHINEAGCNHLYGTP